MSSPLDMANEPLPAVDQPGGGAPKLAGQGRRALLVGLALVFVVSGAAAAWILLPGKTGAAGASSPGDLVAAPAQAPATAQLLRAGDPSPKAGTQHSARVATAAAETGRPVRPAADQPTPPAAAPTAEQLTRRQALRDAAVAQFAVAAAQALAQCPLATARRAGPAVPHRFAVTLQRADAPVGDRGQPYVAVDVADPAAALAADAAPCLALVRALPVPIAAGDLPEERIFTQFVEIAIPGALLAHRDDAKTVQPGGTP